MPRQRYRPKADRTVVAVQLRLDTEGFRYQKWGHEQRCKPGDWLVDSDGDIHTVNSESFARTYREVRPGAFVRTAPVWAESVADQGTIETQEGRTSYGKGDYLVSNNEDGSDAYAISAERFQELYELDE